MRTRSVVAAAAALLCAAGAVSPALAAPAANKGSWTFTATPNPTGNVPQSNEYCEPVGGVGRATQEFTVPGAGSLEVNLNNTLDWSGDLRDKKTGEVIHQSDGGAPQDKEILSATFKKATTVIVGACNLEGEPSITATWTFTPKKKR
jgi:type II secretory pathway pseudopilin PulG